MKKLLTILGLMMAFMAVTAPLALAQVQIDPNLHPEYAPVVVLSGGSSADYGNYFLQLIAGGLLYLAGPVAILFIAVAGLRYVTSHGDQNQLEGAKKTLEWAIIGLVVVIFSYAIVRAIITFVLQTPTAPQSVTAPTPGAPPPADSGKDAGTPNPGPVKDSDSVAT